MVHTCTVCKLSSADTKDVSFHRFPKNGEKRQTWADALGILIQYIGDWTYVCGNHFTSDCYVFSYNKNMLKPDAIPFVNANIVDDSHSICNNIVVQYSDDDDDGSSLPITCTPASDNYVIVSYKTPIRRKIALTSDLPAHKTCPKNKVNWSSTRFGDLSERDFGTPDRAARNFKVVKTTVTKLRKKNKNLHQKCKRLGVKVNKLNKMICILKQRLFMKDVAVGNSNIQVHHGINLNPILPLSTPVVPTFFN